MVYILHNQIATTRNKDIYQGKKASSHASPDLRT
jgi:hypothetical protein